MSITSIMGIILWVVFVLFGSIKFPDAEITNPIVKAIAAIIVFPLVGLVLSAIGLLGIVFVAPLLELFGWNWFIVANF